MIAHGLDRATIAELMDADPPLVSGYVDLAAQLQPNGFDLTLAEVAAFTEPGVIGETNAQRRLAETSPMPFGEDGMLHLEPGPYRITFNEVVSLPLDVMTIGQTRSSLLRSGVAVHGGIGDAGFRGAYQALLVVYHPGGFTVARNARLLQVAFFRLVQPVTEGYQGRFQEPPR